MTHLAAPAGAAPPIFVADHPALDFLNTEATPGTVRLDWLSDGAALLGWMRAAGLIAAADADALRQRFPPAQLDAVAVRARGLRAWWRGFVEARRGAVLAANLAEIAPLREALELDDSHPCLEPAADGALRLGRRHRWSTPEPMLAIIAQHLAELLSLEDWRLVRACEGAGCTNHFLDRTKAHKRRWCSMAICGNRSKVAAHRARRRP